MITEQKYTATAEAVNSGDIFATHMKVGTHEMIADEPLSVGGGDEGPSPGEYLCMALASCTAITLRMYVKRKGWAIDDIHVKAKLQKTDKDGETINTFYCTIGVKGENITQEQIDRIFDVSKACPVHKLLGKPNEVITEMEP